MSGIPFDASVVNAFSGLRSRMAAEEARSTGDFLGIWPDPTPGEDQNLITGMRVEQRSQKGRGQQAGQTFPVLDVQFFYKRYDHPNDTTGPFEWSGNPMTVPMDAQSPLWVPGPGKSTTKYALELGRLKGFLTSILGDEYVEDTGVALQKVHQLINDSAVICMIRRENRPWTDQQGVERTDRNDFCVRSMST